MISRRPAEATSEGRQQLTLAVDALLGVTILGSVLALGSVMTWARVSLGVVAALMTGLLAATGRGVVGRVRLPALILMALAGWSVLSAAPVPVAWLEVLSPEGVDIWRDAFRALGEPLPGALPLSLDPGASIREALGLAVYASVVVAAADFGARRGTRAVALGLFGVGVAVSVVTLVHGIFGAARLYGIYEPTIGIGPWHIAPLLNANNLAGYLLLTASSGAGLLLLRVPPVPRSLLLTGGVVVLTTFSLAASRAGVIAFLVALAALGIGFWRFERSRRAGLVPRRRALAIFAVLIGLSIAVAALSMGRQAVAEVTQWSTDKVELLAAWWPMLGDFWPLGIGRGAFESVSPAYASGPGEIVFSHPENFVVQLLAEWGAFIGTAAIIGLGYCFRPSALGASRRFPVVGILAGAVGLIVHNLADLSLEVPAVAILLLAGLGGSIGGARRRVSGRPRRSVPFAIGVAALLLCAGTLAWGRPGLAGDRQMVERAIAETDMADAASRSSVEGELRAALLRHPAEPYFYRAAALLAWLGRDAEPLPWVSAALRRGPESSRTHFLLAVMLAERQIAHQALLELGLAVRYDTRLTERVAKVATALTREPRELSRVAPEGPRGADVLLALAEALPNSEASARLALLRDALVRSPGDARVEAALARDLFGAVLAGEAPCAGDARERCLHEADRLLARLGERDVSPWIALVARTERDLAKGAASVAEERLRDECPRFSERSSLCLKLRLRAAAASRERKRLATVARVYAAHACADSRACDEALETIASAALDAGFPGLAVRYRSRWAEQSPTVARWLVVARDARIARDRPAALRALERARRLSATPSERDALEAEARHWNEASAAVP